MSTLIIEQPVVSTLHIETGTILESKTVELQIISEGVQGPPGSGATTVSPSEEEMALASRVDFYSETEMYKGEAQPGTAEGSPGWRIKKVVISSDGDVTTTWASGDSLYNKSWALRNSYLYS